MENYIIEGIVTRARALASILRYYLETFGVLQFIDNKVPLDPRRNGLIRGKAFVTAITGILFKDFRLYKLCNLANETTMLDKTPPGLDPEEYFAHRPRDAVILSL